MNLSIDTFFNEVYIRFHRRNTQLHDKKLFDSSGKETIEKTSRNVCSILLFYVKNNPQVLSDK